MTDWKEVGRRIKAARETKGWTQAVLGRHVNSPANYVTRVEGGLPISEKKLGGYADALGVTVPYLRYGVASSIDEEVIRRAAREEARVALLRELRGWIETREPSDATAVALEGQPQSQPLGRPYYGVDVFEHPEVLAPSVRDRQSKPPKTQPATPEDEVADAERKRKRKGKGR